ncbi:calcium ion binding protein [Aureococcus anophagefferens]|nr:calcium ion binding protein [Aureococcus anophagefferens]
MGLPMPLRLVVAAAALQLATATTLSVSPTQLYAEEWDATASITYEVSVAAQPSSDVVVTITSSNASLATADAETLTFTSADYAAKTVTVTVADDNKAGASEHAVEFSHDCTGCDAATVTLTIFDDDYCARDCDAGAYSSTCNGTRRCLDCPRGATCAGGCDAPELCAPGTYKAVMGATNGDGCDACPAGHYAAEYGAASCEPCPAGYACGSGASVVACAAGTYSLELAMDCGDCPAGKVAEFEAMGACSGCPKGHACPSGGYAVPCASGTYSLGNLTNCTACPAGYSCPSSGAAPALCGDGAFSLSNWQYCVSCPLGHSCTNVAVAPAPCEPGTAAPGNATHCAACPTGRYTGNATGAPRCDECPGGFSCDDPAEDPALCANGTSASAGSIRCDAPGVFISRSSSERPADRSRSRGAGARATRRDLPRAGSDCAPGEYSAAGATECAPCPAGHACAEPGAAPAPCANGTFAEGNATLRAASSALGEPSMIPTLCPAGAPGNNTRCLRCPAGYHCGDPAASPAPCGYATYSPGGWQNCSYCAEGRLPSFDRSECVDCAAGFQCPFYDQEVQLPCTLGTYSEGGQAYCTSCPAGYACADRAAPPTDAELCAEGYFSEGARDACVACPNGVACAGTDTAATNPCDAGTYSPLGEMDCLKCPRGSYCPSPTSGEYPCDLGTYSLTNATNCTVCPPGFACPDAATVVVCTEGFYSPGGLTQCLDCNPGYRCPNASSTPSPPGSECAAGTWCNPPSVVEYCPPGTLGNTTAGRSADHACAPCPPGYYCDGMIVDVVDPIAVEAYGGTVFATAKLCDRGGYCPESSAEPTLCDAGTYNPLERATDVNNCRECLAGWACENMGMYRMLDAMRCAAGYVCPPGTASVTQWPCDAGTFSDSRNLTHERECDECLAGYVCDSATTSNTIADCSAGYYCPPGTSSTTMANEYACVAGTYSAATNLGAADECDACNASYYCSGGGSTVTATCTAGHYCPEGTGTPVECPAGTYSPNAGNDDEGDCADCPRGSYCEAGSTAPAACPAGSFAAFANTKAEGPESYPEEGEACALCPAGSARRGRQEPEPCGVGNHSAAARCTYCPEGMARAPDLYRDACPAGYYCPTATAKPQPCPAGTFNRNTGMDAREDCVITPQGYYSISATSNFTDYKCAPGHWCPTGSTGPYQVPCPERFYNPDYGGGAITACGLCKSGGRGPPSAGRAFFFLKSPPSFEPTNCPSGTYNNYTGATSKDDCADCPPGYYCAGSNNPYPTGKCGEGSYRKRPINQYNAEGELNGDLCPKGHYCPQGGQNNPIACPVGTFYPGLGNDANSTDYDCEPCSPGFACNTTGIVTPKLPCDPGFFCRYAAETHRPDFGGSHGACSETNTKKCDYGPCPTGYQCPGGTGEPEPCLPGFYSNRTGMTACAPCEPGERPASAARVRRWCDGKRTDELLPCPRGSYCPNATGISQPSCLKGTYGHRENLTQATDCASCAGSFCSKKGLTQPDGECFEGFYWPGAERARRAGYYCGRGVATATPAATVCPAGSFCANGSVVPTACEPGSYAPTASARASAAPLGPAAPRRVGDGALPPGYFCPNATASATAHPCPPGTFADARERRRCRNATRGTFALGFGNPRSDGECDEGYWCFNASTTATPYLAVHGGSCGPATLLRWSSSKGTFSYSTGNANLTDCAPCTGGFTCPENGTAVPPPGAAGTYRPAGTTNAPVVCPAGHFCGDAVAEPEPCAAGTYQSATGASSCTECPPRHFCEVATATPAACPAGSFCPNGTAFATEHLCPRGSYGASAGLEAEAECAACDGGSYCETAGLAAPTGECDAGFFCASGSKTATPRTKNDYLQYEKA